MQGFGAKNLWGQGFRALGLGSRFRVSCSGFRVSGLASWGFGLKVEGFELRV